LEKKLVQTISSFTHCRWTPCKVLPNMKLVLKSTPDYVTNNV